jgi:hypothetical protein
MKFVLTVNTSSKAISKGLYCRETGRAVINTCRREKIPNVFLESIQTVENFKSMHEGRYIIDGG